MQDILWQILQYHAPRAFQHIAADNKIFIGSKDCDLVVTGDRIKFVKPGFTHEDIELGLKSMAPRQKFASLLHDRNGVTCSYITVCPDLINTFVIRANDGKIQIEWWYKDEPVAFTSENTFLVSDPECPDRLSRINPKIRVRTEYDELPNGRMIYRNRIYGWRQWELHAFDRERRIVESNLQLPIAPRVLIQLFDFDYYMLYIVLGKAE